MASATTLASLSALNSFSSSSSRLHSETRHPASVRFHRALRISAVCASTAERTELTSQFNVSSSTSLYEVLGIEMGASCQEIKIAYRKMARVVHPDVAGTSSQKGKGRPSTVSLGPVDFIKVHDAYTTLSDPVKRAHYDRSLCTRSRKQSLRPTLTMGSTDYRGRKWETDQCW